LLLLLRRGLVFILVGVELEHVEDFVLVWDTRRHVIEPSNDLLAKANKLPIVGEARLIRLNLIALFCIQRTESRFLKFLTLFLIIGRRDVSDTRRMD
jgi:hypothetical protein